MKETPTFTDYLSILYRWRKLIIINMLLFLLIVAGLTLLMDNKYKASATVMLPSQNGLGGGALGGLLSNAGSLLGGGLLGMGGDEADKMLGILGSRVLLEKVINKFDLIEYYEFSKYKRDRTLKALRQDLIFDMNENSMIEITMVHKDTTTSAQIVNYAVTLLDTLNKKISSEEATNYRLFVEKRYKKNLEDIQNAEEGFENFQKKYGVLVIPEQIEFAIKSVGELEAQLFQIEMQASLVKESQGENAPAYLNFKKQIKLLKNKLSELKNGSKSIDESIVFFPFKKAPEIQKNYIRLYREIEIQGKIQEFIMPIYEQALMEEQKNLPTITVLDKAVPPQIKYSPKRSFIVLGIGFLFFFMLIIFVFRGEQANNRTSFNNPIEEKESKFFKGIIRIFGLKF